MITKISLVVVLFVISLPRLSFCEMYQWINTDGSVGIADDISKVPDKYRNQVERKKYQADSDKETKTNGSISDQHDKNDNLRLNRRNSRKLSPQTRQESESNKETNNNDSMSGQHAENENLRLNKHNSRGLSSQTKQEIGSNIFSLWDKFRSALSRNDLNTALDCIELSQRRIYQQNFNLLKDHLQEIAADLTDLEKCDLHDDAVNVECDIVSKKSGQTQASPVQFVRDLEGTWRIYFF
jgi:hypothetical protein